MNKLFCLDAEMYEEYAAIIPLVVTNWFVKPEMNCLSIVDERGGLSFVHKEKLKCVGVRPVTYCNKAKGVNTGATLILRNAYGRDVSWVVLDSDTGLCITEKVVAVWEVDNVFDDVCREQEFEALGEYILEPGELFDADKAIDEGDAQAEVHSKTEVTEAAGVEASKEDQVSERGNVLMSIEESVLEEDKVSEKDSTYEQIVPEELRDIISKEVILRIYEEQFEQILEQKLSEYDRRLTEVEQQAARREAALTTRNRVLEAEAVARAKRELKSQRVAYGHRARGGSFNLLFNKRLRRREPNIYESGYMQSYDEYGNPTQETTLSRMGRSVKGFFFGLGITTVVIVLIVLIITSLAKVL